MRFRLLYAMLVAALLAAAFAALTLPASAELRTFRVKLPTGELITVTVDAPPDLPMDQVPGLPGVPVAELTPPKPEAPPPGGDKPDEPAPADPGTQGGGGQQGGDQQPEKDEGRPRSGGGDDQRGSGRRRRNRDRDTGDNSQGKAESRRQAARRRRARVRARQRQSRRERLRNSDGSPTRQNPTFFDALPGPSKVTSVPNFVIRKFRVPIFLLPIYQAAGMQYGIRWEVLAAINEIETDYGRNLNVSSAGAVGWMQFMPATWKMYGVDANKDDEKDPYNPVDAIFAAARYLKAAGAEEDLKRAIFAYNHADWYVDSVLLRARLISGVPDGLLGSLTGLTDARFPVAARARYADDVSEHEAERRIQRGQNAAHVIEGEENRRGIEIYTKQGAPAVAVNDGQIKRIGYSRRLGRYIVLQDVYGNRYTYAGLGKVATHYPVPKNELGDPRGDAQTTPAGDPAPDGPASAGRQVDGTDSVASAAPQPQSQPKQRLFAHPNRPAARRSGGAEQVFDAEARREHWETYGNFFARPLGLNARNAKLKRLRKGSRVIGGTVLGRVGKPDSDKAAHLYFEIRPAGRGAPRIDPKPILDGWKLLESTAIYRASGRNVLYGDDADGFSVGQILLLPKPLLERRVMSDPRIEIYPCGRRDIRTGQINRRVLGTLAYLAEVGLRPMVTSLKCGHGFYTKSGNVSHHSSGNAVDIAAINGIPILGHQEKGGITHQTIRRLLMMQGTLKPAQIISLIEMGGPTFAMGDHADHIHVGFTPLFGANRKQGQQALQILKPGQWEDLIDRLGEIDNPIVPLRTSRYSLPTRGKHRHSHAHRGE
jgi:murein DD-endopeptidase MepM/ murein hydrolase activator NlpD